MLVQFQRNRLTKAFYGESEFSGRSNWVLLRGLKDQNAVSFGFRVRERRLEIEFVGAELLLERLTRMWIVGEDAVGF